MKESEPKVKNQEVTQLLDYGFSLYENVRQKSVEVVCKEDVVSKDDIEALTLPEKMYNYFKAFV